MISNCDYKEQKPFKQRIKEFYLATINNVDPQERFRNIITFFLSDAVGNKDTTHIPCFVNEIMEPIDELFKWRSGSDHRETRIPMMVLKLAEAMQIMQEMGEFAVENAQ